MNDHYWVRPRSLDITWKDVSPFSNEFGLGLDENEKAFSPNASLQGQMQKHWVCDNDKERSLVKSYEENLYSVFNEVFVSQLYSSLNLIPFVSYKLEVIDGVSFCSCKSLTNEQIEFVPAWDICGRKALNYNDYIDKAVEVTGLDKELIQRTMDVQTMMDFIITNVDRHLNNFGFLRDAHTLEYISPSPIFDNDRSFLTASKILELNGRLPDPVVLSFKANTFNSLERDNLKRVEETNKRLIDISVLPKVDDVRKFYVAATGDDPNSLGAKTIARLYEKKLYFFSEWQNGRSLGSIYSACISRR